MMTWSPMLWGASLACALGGALAGNAVGSTPVLDRPTIGSFYQSHDSGGEVATEPEPLPDHYPLVTPQGVIPVAALSTRGLYRQARYRPYAGYVEIADYEPSRADNFAQPEPAPGRGDATEFAQRFPEEGGDASEGGTPVDLADGPATVPRGAAKLIDVEAALALQ